MGFNTFLPAGYRIEPTDNPEEPIAVYTPHDQVGFYNTPNVFNGNLPSMSQLPGFKYGTGESSGPVALPPINSIARHAGVASVPSQNLGVGAVLPGSVPISGSVPLSIPGIVPLSATNGGKVLAHAFPQEEVEEAQPSRPIIHPPEHRAPVEFNQAINYVNKIKVN
jgi:histone deacetylase complex regulatory component SIN3